MKKFLAILLAAAISLGLSSMAFAAIGSGATPNIPAVQKGPIPVVQQSPIPVVGGKSNGGSNTITPENGTNMSDGYHLPVNYSSDNVVFKSNLPYLYNYGPKAAGNTEASGGQRAKIYVVPDAGMRIVSIKGFAETKNITVSTRKNSGDQANPSYIQISANASTRATELSDYDVTIEMQLATVSGNTLTNKRYVNVSLSGDERVAYSRVRDLEEGERATVSTSEGCIFNIEGYYSETTRIRCTETANLYVKGQYANSVNLRVDTSSISSAEKLFPDSNMAFYNFVGTPTFRSSVLVELEGGPDSNVYSFDNKTGAAKKVATKYSNGSLTFTAKKLGWYFVADGDPIKVGK